MRIATIVFVMSAALIGTAAFAAPGAPPTGYTFSNVSAGLTLSTVNNINQLAFKPGDPTHVYASRGFSNVVTRYNYNAIAGQLSSPVDVLNLSSVADGMKVITGIAFHGNDLWTTRWPGYVVPRPTAITRHRDVDGNGLYGDQLYNAATGMNVGDHNITQLQIVGNSLYVGIGVQKNTGDPNVEKPYNGTIARIGNLNAVPVNTMNLGDSSQYPIFDNSSISDGMLRRYAEGFRNPYGVRVRPDGSVWASDNGASAEGSFPETQDLLYKNLKINDRGVFPPVPQPGAQTPTITPTYLGLHGGATGFDVIPTGPDRGNTIVGHVSTNATNGQRLKMVNSADNAVTNFMTGFNTPTDVIVDPYGRLLVADISAGVYLLTPPIDADPNLDRKVDIKDLFVLASNWQRSANWYQGDFDRSGFVDSADLTILARNWQLGTGALSQALTSLGLPETTVPEPAGTGVILIGLIAAVSRRRRV